MSDIEIPRRMRKLERDRRGYPIPVMVFRDTLGKPHFQITDEIVLRKVIKFDLCPICGSKLGARRWFVGGPKSAFSVRGAYSDPPMHDECAHYALQVCPYIAAPTYSKRLEEKTIKDGSATTVDERVIVERPAVFVAVETTGHTVRDRLTVPKQPYVAVEYWLHGKRLSDEEGVALCQADLKK